MRLFSFGRYRARHTSWRKPSGRRRVAMFAVASAVMAGILGMSGTANASSVSNVTFTGSTYAAGATASWTITFTSTGNGPLPNGNTITVTFASGFSVPNSFTPTVTWGASPTTCTSSTGAGNGSVATVTIGGCGTSGIAKASAISVVLPGITNAGAGTYGQSSFSVRTQADTGIVSPTSGVTIYGTASKLAFAASLNAATAGAGFNPQPSVAVQDSGGRTVGNSSASVTIGVTGGTAALTCTGGLTVNAINGIAQFSGCSMTTAGTFTLTATATNLTSGASNSFVINAASANKVVFVQGPSDAFVGTAMSPAVTVQVQDQYGNAVASNGLSVTLTPSSGSINGGTATTNPNGLATFSGLTFASTVVGVTLTAASGALTAATSSTFNVTVNVTSTANALTDTAADIGSGVASVSYYFCGGLAGSCTPSGSNLIGSSSTAAGNFAVSWSTRPTPGPYRVVVVGADKLGNTSAPSASTPVTVTS